jgi:hypothetical protein
MSASAPQRVERTNGSGWRFRGHEGVSTAAFSPCGLYRYELRRVWKAHKRTMVFVGLNPSTADESTDDPTIRRILGFADDWGYGTLVMLNVFAFRSTDPKALHERAARGRDVIGSQNDATIRSTFAAHRRDKLVIGWGAHGVLLERGRDVAAMAMSVHPRPECLGLTQSGQPKHPLYLAASTKAVRYRAAESTFSLGIRQARGSASTT